MKKILLIRFAMETVLNTITETVGNKKYEEKRVVLLYCQ